MRDVGLRDRTQEFALRVVRLTRALPRTMEGRAVADQLLRSALSVGANYRAACRARSRREFIAKLGLVEEEADESCYWLEMVVRMGLLKAELVAPLRREALELLRIFIASVKRAASERASARTEGGAEVTPPSDLSIKH
jgi:four helix bundle protein